ncbi:pantoate--beta-alanine ligase [Roseospira goensis]|uniref:Pantothenate synthetase n=1 Tax=Roseospira goensis TaxID=391922 RepID=A0A7W6RZ06_9PROT|nr:pantoate--beta-alanine ligase [Roseospira goensis]MBB4285204.1 pantoate--beta-alanine ligase [Roseospira goensis]
MTDAAPAAVSRPVLATVASLRDQVAGWRRAGRSVALVPTMGALHDGHLSLVRLAAARCDRVVVSIFVNPTQFGPTEDFARYPRPFAADCAAVASAGGHAVYAPPVEEMYPAGMATTVTVGGVSEGLCGATRPGHFQGVATVVSKLLLQALPDIAVFGEKDYQQLQVIRRLVRDLDVPVEIVGGPTVREADGLALSSRNRYLAPDERAVAPRLHAELCGVAAALAEGTPAAAACTEAVAALHAAGFARVDYVEVRAADGLAPITGTPDGPARVLGAAVLGQTRLIDSVPV